LINGDRAAAAAMPAFSLAVNLREWPARSTSSGRADRRLGIHLAKQQRHFLLYAAEILKS
jgi:hypothetical protein